MTIVDYKNKFWQCQHPACGALNEAHFHPTICRACGENRPGVQSMKTFQSCLVTNEAGTEIEFYAAAELMDDEIREELHNELEPCAEPEFFAAYCAAHRAKYGEEFEPNKRNPVW